MATKRSVRHTDLYLHGVRELAREAGSRGNPSQVTQIPDYKIGGSVYCRKNSLCHSVALNAKINSFRHAFVILYFLHLISLQYHPMSNLPFYLSRLCLGKSENSIVRNVSFIILACEMLQILFYRQNNASRDSQTVKCNSKTIEHPIQFQICTRNFITSTNSIITIQNKGIKC